MNNSVSIIICSYNRHASLKRALSSIVPQLSMSQHAELIVVDNAPDSEQAKSLAAGYSGVERLTFIHEQQQGLSVARNRGLTAASGTHVAYLDDDVEVHAGWLAAMQAAVAAAGPDTAMIGGRVVVAWNPSRPKWIHDDVLGYLGRCDYGETSRYLTDDEYIVGCNMVIEASSLKALGGFSTALGRSGMGTSLLSNEELDISQRFVRAGRKLYYAADASVDHVMDSARLNKEWFRRRAAWQAVSDVLSLDTKLAPRAAESRLRRKIDPFKIPLMRIFEGEFGREQSALSFRRELQRIYDQTLLSLL